MSLLRVFLKDARTNILNKDAFSGLLHGNQCLKKKKKVMFPHQLQSIKQQAHLVPSVTSSLIRENFCFLSENQDWFEPR